MGEYIYLTPDILERIDRHLNKFPFPQQAIIPSLHDILDKYRDIPDQAVFELADYLKVPPSDIEGIVSFYDMFRHKKNARNHIRICRNLPCHLGKYQLLLEKIKNLTGADIGKNSPDGKWYIELVECIGSCAIAPAFLINDDLYDGSKIVSEEDLKKILSRYE
ncbi:MAG TPA: NADH dehydrogenase FAD-containing subunit [Persephonella sp.]|uniref:NADH-quinone oxidoreductase subunit e (Nadhdehydrogenase i subunit e) (Ndh-1 subunit e) n=1 Tax=Persephonella marina (strain DSM 14350 / EX-H1) TaxID=123214 RepID=C0QQ00_PERMH|nr:MULTISPECIES: NAD(P)H-dependent oxidoreductase subunit E [Persephonella]ACO03457.1 NADH-quinone oxidoreductase subunit e (nadhdehydrogenase i subunit e) (ndh-1 subunit e) [Persephonella marina EX-H1]HCB69639.1 NADH dehydrogenase FAD-containing subunit [Persephonella sp.]